MNAFKRIIPLVSFQFLLVATLGLPPSVHAAESESSLVKQFWQAVDDRNPKALRKLVAPQARDRNLNAYLEQYIQFMSSVRSKYSDPSAYTYKLIADNEMHNYDGSIPALYKDDQLDVYPMPASAFLQLSLELDSGEANIDVLPVTVDKSDWALIFPSESIAWPGLEQRFRTRLDQPGGPSPLAPNSLIPIHVELPAFVDAMGGVSGSGCARISYTLQPDGIPDDIKTQQSEPTALPGKSARKSFKKWRFIPGGDTVQSEFLILFLVDLGDVEAAGKQAELCGGTLDDSFLVTPSGQVDPALIPQFQQSTPDRRY